MKQSQISAFITMETKELLERYSRAKGIKKAFLIESALLHHLKALLELPADVIIPPRLVVSKKSGEKIIEKIKKPAKPTKTMRALFSTQDELSSDD
jgi:hypothetical protein